jgi:hypothetical protein
VEIHGFKWNDLDEDGVWDQQVEPGLPGWTIFLDSNNNRILDAGETSVTTGADGSYAFTDLPAGDYVVAEVLQPGWTQTSPTANGTDPIDLIINGGFETGNISGWTLQDSGSGTFVINDGSFVPLSLDGPLPPFAGAFAVVSDQGGPGTHIIYQDVAIPAGGPVTLQWADRIRNHAGLFEDPNQEFRVEIRNTAGQIVETVFSTNPGDLLVQDWTERDVDLSAFAGQTVRVAFVEEDNLGFFNVHIDHVRLIGGSDVGVSHVSLSAGDVANDINFGNHALPSSIQGQKWNDLDGDGAKDAGEPGLAGWTIFIDQNANRVLDAGERSTATDADGNYSFTDLTPGEYIVGEVQQAGWEQTAPTTAAIDQLLDQLNANHAAISALVPTRFDFFEGESGNNIGDGGNDMYDGGNFLNTNLASAIPYTDRVVTPSDAAFGPASQYFTAKYPGLFVLAAVGISIDTFSITGDNGADGIGAVNGAVLSTTVNSQQYTVYVKRVFNAFDPSVNHIIIVPGDGTGVSHSFPSDTNDDLHTVNGLGAVDELYYLLVARDNGALLANAAVVNIANQFLGNITAGSGTVHRVDVAAGQDVINLDFGNRQLPVVALAGDYNRDGTVNAADLVVWRKTLGAQVTPFSGADGNGNGLIDEADYEVWRSHFGQTLPPPAAGRGVANLVDPSAAPEKLPFRPEPRSPLNVRRAIFPNVSDGSESRQDAALLAWLSLAWNRDSADRDAANISSDVKAESRDSYFESFDQAFAEIEENPARTGQPFQRKRGPLL